jgi:hypothetical protein
MADSFPAIHAFAGEKAAKDVDAGNRSGHDEELDATSKIPSKGLNCVDLSGYCGFALPA